MIFFSMKVKLKEDGKPRFEQLLAYLSDLSSERVLYNRKSVPS